MSCGQKEHSKRRYFIDFTDLVSLNYWPSEGRAGENSAFSTPNHLLQWGARLWSTSSCQYHRIMWAIFMELKKLILSCNTTAKASVLPAWRIIGVSIEIIELLNLYQSIKLILPRSSLIHFACIGVAPPWLVKLLPLTSQGEQLDYIGSTLQCRQNGSDLTWSTYFILIAAIMYIA